MAYYEIENTVSGLVLGIYAGDSPEEAIKAMDEDAGSGSYRVVPVEDPTDLHSAGYDANCFRSEAEAEAAIKDLSETVGGKWDVTWEPSPGIVARKVEPFADALEIFHDDQDPTNSGLAYRVFRFMHEESGQIEDVQAKVIEVSEDEWAPYLRAIISFDDIGVGEVFLRRNENGNWGTWGDMLDCWVDRYRGPLYEALASSELEKVQKREVINWILDAVNKCDY